MNAERLMAKAQRALEAATRAAQAGDTETAADRVYYSVYYAAWALLDSSGSPRPKTHRGLIAEFSRLFVKDGPLDTASGAVLSRLENLNLVDWLASNFATAKALLLFTGLLATLVTTAGVVLIHRRIEQRIESLRELY